MGGSGRARRDDQLQRWTRAGVPTAVAESCGNAGALVTTLPVIDAAERRAAPPQTVATIFANLNATLSIDWLVDQLSRVVPTSLWQAMERDLLLDDLMNDHAALAARICIEDCAGGGEADAVDRWTTRQAAFVRSWRGVMEGPQRATSQDFSLLSMTCRKLGDLIRTLPASTL
jgi:NAD-specific glutamate dehydrogenase